MMSSRTRSRSRSRQRFNYKRHSRSRSPYYPMRDKGHQHHDFEYREKMPRDNRRRNDFRDHHRPHASPVHRQQHPYMHASRSPSPRNSGRKQSYDPPLRRGRSPHRRSPSFSQSMPQQHVDHPPREERIFKGPEGTVINLNELKKITVDIRRNIPRGIPIHQGALHFKFDPNDVIIVRRPGEGSRPIFDREELKPRSAEERVIKLSDQLENRTSIEQPPPERIRASRSPIPYHESQPPKNESESDLRYRLMEKKNHDDMKDRNSDPNFVPQPRYHNEHDNRERFHSRGRGYRGFNNRGNYRGHSNFRGNFRGHPSAFRGTYRKRRSPDWEHDLYSQMDDAKPSSTTPM